MEGTVVEFPEVSNFFNIEQQDLQHALHGQILSIDNSQQWGTMEDGATDNVDQYPKCCIRCGQGFSSKEIFVYHICMEENEAYSTECSELWTDKPAHINYYDPFQDVDIISQENVNNTELREDIFSFELSDIINSLSEDVNDNTGHLEDCSPLNSQEMRDDTLLVEKIVTNDNLDESYIQKKKVLVNVPSETRNELTPRGKISACNFFDYKCNQKSNLREHIRRHTGEKPYACHICDYKCRQKSYLRTHISTHTGEKPFACNMCAYKCSRKSYLIKHIRTHTVEKPFACNICDYKCNQKSYLRIHIRIHSDEKAFACNICDYKCKRNDDLKRHLKTHTSEKSFACHICDYKCNLKSHLRQHIRTHTGEKAFACDICDYKFKRNYHLKRHMIKHTGEKPFSCDFCDYRFSQRSDLRKHKRTHSGE